MNTISRDGGRAQKLASYLHGYLLNIYNAQSFRRLSDDDLRHPGRFSKLPGVPNEVSTALGILLRLGGLNKMEPVGLRVDRHEVGGQKGSRVALLLSDSCGKRHVLAMFRSESAASEDTFRFSPFEVSEWVSQEPRAEGLIKDIVVPTGWGELLISPSEGSIRLQDTFAVYSFDIEGGFFSIGYGSGPLRRVGHYHSVPISFVNAVEFANRIGRLDGPTFRLFKESLESLPGKFI